MMATSAPVGDVVQWLNNRLGNAEKTWVDDSSVAPYLTKELLEGILDCFLDLQTHTKIKLLLSFLHIVRRTVENLRNELESVIDLAAKDPDPWVSLTAELIRHFPSKGEFNVMVRSPMFNGMRNDVMKHLKRLSDRTRELQLVPYEAQFMNKKAFNATYGNAAAPVKHFTLKQKPKSATLRADALLRANEAKPKNLANPSLPVRFKDQIKGIDQILAGPGQPSAAIKRAYAAGPQARVQAAKEKSLAAAKARPAIKMLDITEQPLAQDQGPNKRRRKLVGVPVTGSGAATGDGKTEDDASGTTEKDREGSPAPAEEEANTSASSPTKIVSFGSPNPALDQSKSRQLSPEIPVPQPASSSAPPPPTAPPTDIERNPAPVEPASPIKAAPPQPSPVSSSAPQVIHPQPGSLMDLSKLKITKETQKTIAEIFAKANRVTRPEKILIINFIAGIRANPCPHLGPVLTVRLSENLAPIILSDGQQIDGIVEEYFHMNFGTGEWKRLRKQKPLPAPEPGQDSFGTPTPIPPVSTLTPTPSNSQMFQTGSPSVGFNQGQGNPGRSPF